MDGPMSPKKEKSDPLSPAVSTEPKNVQDLTVFVENLLSTMQDKFQAMSDQILTRMDDMGGRIDELEKNIGDLMQQAGIEDEPAKKLLFLSEVTSSYLIIFG
eukprot:TCONS_00060602-protein